MALKSPSSKSSEILCFNFNQDFSCVAVGTSNGFRIFKCIPFGECLAQADGGIGIVEMLFRTNLLALVGAGDQPALSPRRLRLWNTKTQATVCDLNFVTSILAVKMNKKRMIVVLETKVHIFELSPLHFLHSLDTGRNPKGVCALSSEGDKCILAVPGEAAGSVCVFDALGLHVLCQFHPHGSIACLAFNQTGSLLATASEKGTVIRVYSVPSMERICALRRGSKTSAIQCLTFNTASTLLCVTSDSPTIHIFRLEDHRTPVTRPRHGSADNTTPPVTSSPVPPSQPSSLPISLTALGLSGMLTDIVESSRNFAYIRLKGTQSVKRSICAIDDASNSVIVVTGDGVLCRYKLDVVAGGECKLEEEDRLDLGDQDHAISSGFM
eukprot:c1066_g1_i1.p1 GENE.c1066_g1_i1~~c1066_g1_i1.p1  ORF type:complete len:382 (+),score=108.41 c1066_g1_i1:204-1349(+)